GAARKREGTAAPQPRDEQQDQRLLPHEHLGAIRERRGSRHAVQPGGLLQQAHASDRAGRGEDVSQYEQLRRREAVPGEELTTKHTKATKKTTKSAFIKPSCSWCLRGER